MTTILIFVIAVMWGSLSGQFLVQTMTFVILTGVYLSGIIFSRVSKGINFAGVIVGVSQSMMFGTLVVGGNWAAGYIVDYSTWNAASIASLAAFVLTIIYVLPQVPGKILLGKMCAWVPDFMEAQMHVPRNERVAFARKWRSDSPD